MATPSLKKMEGGIQEGIYASSNTSYADEADRTDLGLTLLPGSQIQTECDKQGHSRPDNVYHEREFLRELKNGSKRGVASQTGQRTLHGKAHNDVYSQEKSRDTVEIEPEGNTVSRRLETTCVPGPARTKSADGSGDRARSEPYKASVVSEELARSCSCDWDDSKVQICAYPVNVSVNKGSSPTVREIDKSEAGGSVHEVVHSVEGECMVLGDESGSGESYAEGGLEEHRPYKRQKTDENLPCSLFYDLQDALVSQLDLGVDLWERGLNAEDDGLLSTEALRSRSHSTANDVVRVARGTGSKSPYAPPRPTSTLAFEPRSHAHSTPRSFEISSGLSTQSSALSERFYTPLSTLPQTSQAITTAALATENPATSRQVDLQSISTAPSASIANPSNTAQTDAFSTLQSQPESARNERSAPLGRLPSTTAVPLHDNQEPKRLRELPVAINSFSALRTQTTSAEVLHKVSSSTMGSAEIPFTGQFEKCSNDSIHGAMSLDNTADTTITQEHDPVFETALPPRIRPLPRQEAYESPYAPKSRRLQQLLGSQTDERNTAPNTGYRGPMEQLTLENAMAATPPIPSPGSQHPHPATLTLSKTPPQRTTSQFRPVVQLKPKLSVPLRPVPGRSSVSKTALPARAPSEQDSAESYESSSESSSDESLAPTERIAVSPALVNTAKKGLHAITSVIISRVHHADIVPRVVSFIETFPSSSDPPAPPRDSEPSAGDACPAEHKDLLYKNHSLSLRNHELLQRNAIVQKERDRFKRAAREWATTDPESGLTKGQSMSREVRSLRSKLADKTVEVERLRKAWFDFEASRPASQRLNHTVPLLSEAPPSHGNRDGRDPCVDVVWQDNGPFSGCYEKRSVPTAEPTPPASKRVSIDLTESTPEPSSALATLPSALSPPLPSSPTAAALRSTMKRKTYSWLPDKSNHMVTKPRPAARGKRPSTAIDLDVEGPVFDAEAELEAELERELLASQHAEEREQQRKRQRRQSMTAKQKAMIQRRANAGATAATTGPNEDEMERLAAEKQRRVKDEQRQREAEERAMDQELFGSDEEEHVEMVDVYEGAEGGRDEAAELALSRAMEDSWEESEED